MTDIETVVNGLNDIGGFIAGRIGIEQARNFLRTIDDAIALLKEQETIMQCIKGKCRICPHCANCDVDENGLLKEQEAQRDYEASVEMAEYCERYEHTYNPEDGSM